MKFCKDVFAYSCFCVFLGSDSDSAWIFPHNVIHFFACSAFLTLSKEVFILYYKFGCSQWIRGRFRVLFTEKKWKFNTDHPGQGRDPYAGIKGVTF